MWSRNKVPDVSSGLLQPSPSRSTGDMSTVFVTLSGCARRTEGKEPVQIFCELPTPDLMLFWLFWFHPPPRKICCDVFSLVAALSMAVIWVSITFWQASIPQGTDTHPAQTPTNLLPLCTCAALTAVVPCSLHSKSRGAHQIQPLLLSSIVVVFFLWRRSCLFLAFLNHFTF